VRGGAEGEGENPKQTHLELGAQHGALSHDPGIMTRAETKSWTLTD